MGRFIRQCQLVIGCLKVTNGGMHIHRLHRVAADEMNAVEILAELEKILAFLSGARHLPAQFHIPIIWR